MSWQESAGGGQLTGFSLMHAPDWQASVCVQKLPSSHGLPSVFEGLLQTPVDALHVPAVWHWSCAVQTTGFEPVHASAMHWSVCVQRLPSLHGAPSGLLGFEQVPVAALQVPAVWHWSCAVQLTGFEPVHVPD